MDGRCGSRARLAGAALVLVGAACAASDASAECVRRITNRSTLVLTARRDGGPPVTILPGEAVPIRLTRPGRLELAAYCGVPGADGALKPVAQASFAYEAVLDRCFIRFGDDLFPAQLGRGFLGGELGDRAEAPFTVNAPGQGDVTLGPLRDASCPVLSRGG